MLSGCSLSSPSTTLPTPTVLPTLKAYRGNQPRATSDLLSWHSSLQPEAADEPLLPVVDPHHHLFNTPADRLYYTREDLTRDVSGGHRIMGTVYVAAYAAGWRSDGPQAMRSVGEVERIVELSKTPLILPATDCTLAAGIVSDVDLSLGDAVGPVLDAHVAAGDHRLRGVRHYLTYHEGELSRFIPNAPQHVMADPEFRKGFGHLERHALSFDALVYHTQLQELRQLAAAFPKTTIVLNHIGMPIGVLDYSSRRAEVQRQWTRDMRALATLPNVVVKLGGLGMPILGFGFDQADRPATTEELVKTWRPWIETCIEIFGPQRCMLESNFPVDKQSCGYTQLWNALKRVTRQYSSSERRHLLYGTACQTYRLPDLQARCEQAVGLAPPRPR